MTTRSTKIKFNEMLKDMLDLSDDSEIHKSLSENYIDTLPDLMTMSEEDIKLLDYTDKNGKKATLHRSRQALLRALRSFIRYNEERGITDYTTISNDDFNSYRIAIFDPGATLSAPSLPSTRKLPNSSRPPVQEFKKTIKRDKSNYIPLTEDKQWDSWRRSTIATARIHDCEEILDPNYKPSTPEEKELFDEKQKFMYAVFETYLQTDMGKHYVRLHESDSDAQAIFIKLSKYATESTQASLEMGSLLTYLTSTKLHTSNWRGTTHAFILNWCDKLRQYEKLVPLADHFTNPVKRTMLQNAVGGIEALNRVKTQNNHDVAHGLRALTYEKYKTLLLSAASIYDEKNGLKRARQKHSVFAHEFDDVDYDFNTQDSYDIDTDLYDIEIHNTDRKPSQSNFRPSMKRDQWNSLSPDEQALWDKFSPKAKSIILGHRQSSTTVTNTFPNTNQYRKHTSSNLHDISAAEYLLQVHSQVTHDQSTFNDQLNNDSNMTSDSQIETQTPPAQEDSDSNLLAYATNQSLPQGDIKKVLSSTYKKGDKVKTTSTNTASTSSSTDDSGSIVINGKTYREINVHSRTTYNVAKHKASLSGSLIDRGANGGLAGGDVRIVHRHDNPRYVDVSGIDSHQVTDLPIVTVGGVVPSQRGDVIAIMHQYAYLGEGKTIHSSAQLEHFKNDVNDKSMKVSGGLQCIQTPDGYMHPLDIRNGLPYIPMRPYTDKEWETLPHVTWTSDSDWDPSVLDHKLTDKEQWYDAVSDLADSIISSPFDEFGNFKRRETELHFFDAGEEIISNDRNNNNTTSLDDIIFDAIIHTYKHQRTSSTDSPLLELHSMTLNKKSPDYESLRPFFLNATADVIKRTFAATTQYARTNIGGIQLKKTFKTPFPACNIHRRNEAVATDTIYSDTPAIDDGSKIAQLYVGRSTLVTDVYGIKTEKQFVNTLEDNIRKRGAMDKLISDRAQVEVSGRVLDILRSYVIDSWQSEPHYQHQNFAERRYSTVKPLVNVLLNLTGAPAYCWLLALCYVCFVLNHTAVGSLNWRTPIEKMTGSTPDISSLLCFRFWEPVYYKLDDADFPSESTERRGRFVGIAENVGHALTFKVLTDDTKKIIYRSRIRSAMNPKEKNLRIECDTSTTPPEIVKAKHHDDLLNGETMPTFDPSELIGRTFLLPPEEDGQRFRGKVIEALIENRRDLSNQPDRIKFRCSVNDDEFEEILSYNDILNSIEKDETEQGLWKFKAITGHQGPLSQTDNEYKGSRFNVLVEWETGETTYEPLHIIGADDPVSCAIYAKENNLLDEPGWKQFKRLARRQQKLIRMANQAKLQSFRTRKVYKFGYIVPRNHEQAMQLDEENGNTKWVDAERTELTQLQEYKTFSDKGKGAPPPSGYKKIRVHFVYDVKHDGRHKARLVAGGHLTEIPIDSVYSSVVSLRGLRLTVFLGELNGLDIWSTDIGNAYLEAETKENVYIIGGPEFGELEGHTLVIFKALYGLRSSGLRWHERFADTLRDMHFFPSKAEDDIWMRKNGEVYEYIATYVDDLCIVAKDPGEIARQLEEVYHFKLKGTGPISYHLGCDFFRDSTGTMCFSPKKYIGKMKETYERMFGHTPKPYSSPLEYNDHPEMDTSEELDEDGIKRYQSLIGALQWAVSLARIDITTAVMTMSSFRAAPRKGHLERVQRIYGYLCKMKHATIRVRTEEPDYSDIPVPDHDWSYSIYGEVKESIPSDCPAPLGKRVTITSYVDANLYHDMLTGRSVSGILHIVNKTPIQWYSKKQGTVETATYGSEFVAARIATEQIIDLRLTLMYLGVPLAETVHMFGDNQSVVSSSTKPHGKLHKRHTALSFHRVREAIASKILAFNFIPGVANPADILSKHWSNHKVW